jgi:hypothetical protein
VSGSGGETTRGFRDRRLGRVLIFAGVLLAALLVSKSCGKTEAEVGQDRAIAIAKQQVDFEPNRVTIRLVKQGLRQKELWLVGLGQRREDGSYVVATNVMLDADTGEVLEIRPVSGV